MDRTALSKLTVGQLRDLAVAHRISGAIKARKTELLDALSAALATQPPAGALTPPQGQAIIPSSMASPSSQVHAAPAASPKSERGPEPGLPIPSSYGRNRLVLMAQDPWHLFAYWEITPETLEGLRQAGTTAPRFVLMVTTVQGQELREVDLAGGNYYLSVAPDAEYLAELAMRDAQGNLQILARSNRIRTPAAAPSSNTDEAWMAIDETFHELLAHAGLPGSGGSSANLSSAELARRVVAWNLTHVDQQALFSGLLQRAPSSLSSHVLQRR